MRKQYAIHSTGTPIAETLIGIGDSKLVGLTLHASAAPTTADVFYVKLDSRNGADFDAVLYSITLSTASTTDIAKTDFNLPVFAGDAVRIEFANTDGVTFGITVLTE
jgi:hypothetical protein